MSCSKVLAKTSDRCRELSDSSISGFKFVAVGPNTLAGMVLVKDECFGLGLAGKKSRLGCLKFGCKGITLGAHAFDVGKLGRGETMGHGGGGGSSGFSGCVSSKHGAVVLFVGSCAGSRLRLRAWGGRRGQVAVDRLGRLLGMLELLLVMDRMDLLEMLIAMLHNLSMVAEAPTACWRRRLHGSFYGRLAQWRRGPMGLCSSCWSR